MNSQKTTIPEQDITDFLPIRWAFTCWVSDKYGVPRWEFARWRSYLLSWEIRGYEVFLRALKVQRFKNQVHEFLAAKGATDPIGFIHFYKEARDYYWYLLRKNGII